MIIITATTPTITENMLTTSVINLSKPVPAASVVEQSPSPLSFSSAPLQRLLSMSAANNEVVASAGVNMTVASANVVTICLINFLIFFGFLLLYSNYFIAQLCTLINP